MGVRSLPWIDACVSCSSRKGLLSIKSHYIRLPDTFPDKLTSTSILRALRPGWFNEMAVNALYVSKVRVKANTSLIDNCIDISTRRVIGVVLAMLSLIILSTTGTGVVRVCLHDCVYELFNEARAPRTACWASAFSFPFLLPEPFFDFFFPAVLADFFFDPAIVETIFVN